MKKWLLVLGLISTSLANAGDEQGFYAGLNLGLGKLRLNTSNGEDKNNAAVAGIVLGYKINPYIGIETQYTGVGKVTDKISGSVKGDALSLTTIGFLPLTDSFNLYGKVGVTNIKTTVSSNLTGFDDARRTAVTYGLGGEYGVDKNIGLRLGWDHYNAAVDTVANGKKNVNADVVSVGAVYHF